MEGAGASVDSLHDGFHFAYEPLNGDGEITVRFVPQPSSQFSQMGLTIREETTDDAAHVSLLLYSGRTGK